MSYWILKSEPSSYSWDDLVKDGRTAWTGVRNNAAALHLRAMKDGDKALLYHSGEGKEAVGIVSVVRAAYQDPTTKEKWVAVDIAADKPLAAPVTLAAMRAEKALAGMQMLRQSRLSVSPVSAAEWKKLLAMASKKQ